MRINELFIGAWVLDHTYPAQITGITCDGNIETTAIQYSDIENVDPIEVTTEFLKKNGCELLEVGDHGVATPKQHFNRYEKWIFRSKWFDANFMYDRTVKKYHFFGMEKTPFAYVHEMQAQLLMQGCSAEIVFNEFPEDKD